MSLKVKDICSLLEQFAPVSLSEDYDNVGLMVGNTENTVSSIMIALDCTLAVIDEAIEKNCNLIISHHPLLFKKPSNITNETLQGTKIIKLIKSNISLYSSHTNLDSAIGGVNDKLVKILGFSKAEVIEPAISLKQSETNLINSSIPGIGRLVTLDHTILLCDLCEIVKEKLGIPVLRYVGEERKSIKKIAIITGSGSDYLAVSRELGADCIITGDITYHYASDYSEMNIAIIDAGHFFTEWPAFREFGLVIQAKIRELGYENSVIFSDIIKDPYKTK